MCLVTFSEYPTIQMWGNSNTGKHAGFGPSLAPSDLIGVTLGPDKHAKLATLFEMLGTQQLPT